MHTHSRALCKHCRAARRPTQARLKAAAVRQVQTTADSSVGSRVGITFRNEDRFSSSVEEKFNI